MSTAVREVPLERKVVFEQSFKKAKKSNHYLNKRLKKAMDNLDLLKKYSTCLS